jgi:hypothetical protein
MLINGLNRTRILIALVLVLLLNLFLYCPCTAHSFIKETRSVKHTYLVNQKPRTLKSYFMNIQYIVRTTHEIGCFDKVKRAIFDFLGNGKCQLGRDSQESGKSRKVKPSYCLRACTYNADACDDDRVTLRHTSYSLTCRVF